jgi:hypothetical protein
MSLDEMRARILEEHEKILELLEPPPELDELPGPAGAVFRRIKRQLDERLLEQARNPNMAAQHEP